MSAVPIITERNVWVTTNLAEGKLVLETFSGHETLGSPFGYDLALLSRDPAIDLSQLLGQIVTVHVALLEGERQSNGVVVHAENASTDGDLTRYRVTLAPWFSLLQFTTNCRIFQNQSVVEIVSSVFRDNNFSDFENALTETYPPRELCVQYRESDFNFVSRLLESEGIYYFFKHENGKHVLVLADGYSAHKAVPGYEDVSYKPQQRDMDPAIERIESWVISRQVRSGSFSATDFDFTRPRVDLMSVLQAPLGNAADQYALYDYPGKFLTTDDGTRTVKVRLQEAQVLYETAEASGNPRALGAGHLFSLADFPRDDQNREYVIIGASYHLHAGIFETAGSHATGEEFRASYRVIDSQTPFRPAPTAHKVRVDGPQTAIVVGEAGEEITTDKYGRVKVQFHWDREGKNDENSSCWVRVAQVWAGAGWGGMHIPRIGQEVIVEFLEGDPDRPIITGRVYNADNMPPYTLPDNKTQSGIKSRSTKGGGPSNFNEIRFEDKKGSEELHIQAEKDQSTHVKHNQSISVDADRSVSVGGNETISVTGTRTSTITKKETQTFKADREMRVTGNDLEDVTGHRTEAHHGGREITVEQGDALTVVGSDKVDAIHGNYDITADSSFQVSQKSNRLLIEDAVTIESVGDIDIKNNGCELSAQNAGALVIEAKQNIQLKCGPATITLNMDGTIELDGVTGISAKAGTSTLTLDPSGASVKGTAVELNGTAGVVVQAPIIKVG